MSQKNTGTTAFPLRLLRGGMLLCLLWLGTGSQVEAAEHNMDDKQKLQELEGRYTLSVNEAGYTDEGRLRLLDLAGSAHVQNLSLEIFTDLRELSLSGCGLENLKNLKFPPHLERLDLSWNDPLQQASFCHLKALSWLNLSYCGLKSLKTTQLPRSLEVLELGGNAHLEILHLEHFPVLRQIDSSSTRLSAITLRGCRKLEQLYLRGNKQLTSLVLLDFPELKKLDLARGHLEGLTLSNLPALEQLLVNDNLTLDSLKLAHLHSLKTLIASGCGFSGIEQLLLPRALETLDLSSNRKLKEVIFTGMENLRSLSLINGNLEKISVHTLPNLITLDLGENRSLQVLELGDLPALKYLHLYKSGLSDLAPGQLPALLELYLTDSRELTRLDLTVLGTLTKLVAPQCALETAALPSSLEILDLQNNPRYNPTDLRPLVKLKKLYLQGCNLDGFSREKLPAGLEEVEGL